MHKFSFRIILVACFIIGASILSSHVVYADDVWFTSTPSYYATLGSPYSYKVTTGAINNYSVTYSFSNLPSWLSFNSTNTTLSGTPTANGKYTMLITANDGHGGTELQSYYLYVTSPSPTPTPIATQTQTPTPTAKPTSQVTITPSVRVSPTPTPKASSTSQQQVQTSIVSLADIKPANGSTITSHSPVVSGVLTTVFSLNKNVFSLFFDNRNVTGETTLTSKVSNGTYETTFSYQTKDLSTNTHMVSLTVNTPDDISVPENWSFMVAGKNTTSFGDSLKSFFQNQKGAVTIIVIAIIILLFIFISLVKRGARMPQQPPHA
jgi:hypothetical protein